MNSPRRYGRPRDVAKGHAVLDAACRQFLGLGYEHTRMDDVAELACVSKTTVYANYATKALLYEATVLHVLRLHIDPLEALVGDGPGCAASLLEFGEAVARLLFHPDVLGLHRLTVETARAHPAIGQLAYSAGYKRCAAICARVIRRHTAAYSPQAGDELAQADRFLSLFFRGAYFDALLEPDSVDAVDTRKIAHEAVEFFERGILAYPWPSERNNA